MIRFLLALVLAVVSLSSGSQGGTAAKPEDRTPRSVLRRYKVVSPGSGWVTTGPPENGSKSTRLYWTDDDGQIWRDITPSDGKAEDIGPIFFLDRLHGWILSSNNPYEEIPSYHVDRLIT